MKARRTPWWYYVLAVTLGAGGGVCLASLDDRLRISLIGAPWIVPIVLAILGVVVLVMCIQVHQYATTDPAKRRSRLDPAKAMMTLVLAKSLGIAGAALLGWYGGQALMTMGRSEAPYYGDAVTQCVVTAAVCLADMSIGIIGEWLCQIPPADGPENPHRIDPRERSITRTAAGVESRMSSRDTRSSGAAAQPDAATTTNGGVTTNATVTRDTAVTRDGAATRDVTPR